MSKTFTTMVLSLGCVLLLFAFYQNVSAQTPQPGFASVVVSNQWNEVVGLTFTNDGVDMFVWERGGRVYSVTGGTKRLVLDISEEVGAWFDHGLLGFALHPQFAQNGHIYLLYIVDRHHLLHYGTAAYSPTTNEYYNATIARVTRYTLSKSGATYSVSPGSRKILLGATKSTGIVSIERSHVTGSLVFGTDQTLLISTGDGANGSNIDSGSGDGTYYAQALTDGILTDALNVGTFRSQILDSYNGKILRIDADTGEGIPSNPFYDPSRPNAAISKVWGLGLRNPFRMYLKPGSGSHYASDGNPGILYIGDVGFFSWEEINVCDKPGMNFGWPIFEGQTNSSIYASRNTLNKFAPNPLYQVNGCTQQYFYFQNLIKQETPDGTAVFTNPCNAAQNIPGTIPTFVHTRPIIDWAHNAAGPSRTGTFSGQTATVANIGAAGSPVAGAQFGGESATGGIFYTGTDFPAEYRNKLFFGDYGFGWIRSVELNDQEKPVRVRPFINTGAVVVGMAANPTGEGLYYVNFPSEIRRVTYSSNQPPVAVASANHIWGASPLTVQFKGDDSNDPEGLQLSYSWNFGDGSPLSNVANPAHTFTTSGTAPTQFTVTLKVTDNGGLQHQTTLIISVNNSPPDVTITSPLNGTLYPLTGETIYPLRASVTDAEHNASQLSYKWQTTLFHEQHSHPEPFDTSPETTTRISPLGCDGETYFVTISLTVTDAAGLSTTKTVTLYPDCENQLKVTPVINWSTPAPIAVGTALSSTQLNATASYNDSPVEGTFVYTPAAETVLSLGTGHQLSVSFTPTDTTVYNSTSQTVTIDVVETVQSIFYRAININGPALVIDGNNWISSKDAPDFSFTTSNAVMSNQGITLVPSTDANRATMIRSSVWGNTVNLNMTAVPSGNYQVWLYVWEDNFAQTYSISLEGSEVLSNFNSGGRGTWSKLGPYPVDISDGAINVSTSGGAGNFSGIEVWAGPSAAGVVTSTIASTTSLEVILDANPNPFSTKLNVRFTARQSGNARVELFDMQGRSVHLLYNGKMSNGETKEKELGTSELPEGIYILEFLNGRHVARLKLLGVQ